MHMPMEVHGLDVIFAVFGDFFYFILFLFSNFFRNLSKILNFAHSNLF